MTPEWIQDVISNEEIQYIQLSEVVPAEVFFIIDSILAERPDITFRIFGLHSEEVLDLHILKQMSHLRRFSLDSIILQDRPQLINIDVLSELKELKSLKLDVYPLYDYSFIQDISRELEELSICALSSTHGVNFTCEWLLDFSKLHTLCLGKRARKKLPCIVELPNLKTLTLNKMKISEFGFLRDKELDRFNIHVCEVNDLSSLHDYSKLKSLDICHTIRLRDLSSISTMTGLEWLRLQDLRHVKYLPDLSKLTRLETLILDNMKAARNPSVLDRAPALKNIEVY